MTVPTPLAELFTWCAHNAPWVKTPAEVILGFNYDGTPSVGVFTSYWDGGFPEMEWPEGCFLNFHVPGESLEDAVWKLALIIVDPSREAVERERGL